MKRRIIIIVSILIVIVIVICSVCFSKNAQFNKQKEQVKIVTPYIIKELIEFKNMEKNEVKLKMFSDSNHNEKTKDFYGMYEIVWNGRDIIDEAANEIAGEIKIDGVTKSDKYTYRKDIFFDNNFDSKILSKLFKRKNNIKNRFCNYKIECYIDKDSLRKNCVLTFYAKENGRIWFEYVRNYCYENFIEVKVKEDKEAYYIYFD